MSQFPDTELILSSENRVYHINLRSEDIADDVIVVGDQHRVAQISKYFSNTNYKNYHNLLIAYH